MTCDLDTRGAILGEASNNMLMCAAADGGESKSDQLLAGLQSIALNINNNGR